MRFDWEPFTRYSRYRRRYQQYEAPEIQDNGLRERAEKKLNERLVSPEKLMYDYDSFGIRRVDTGELFTGKFAIPADKFERIVKVHNGQEVSNLVRIKSGGNYYFEIVGNKPKYFKTNLSEEDRDAETRKLIEADQRTYDEMTDRFSSSQNQ